MSSNDSIVLYDVEVAIKRSKPILIPTQVSPVLTHTSIPVPISVPTYTSIPIPIPMPTPIQVDDIVQSYDNLHYIMMYWENGPTSQNKPPWRLYTVAND
jgi:hypothetical protein